MDKHFEKHIEANNKNFEASQKEQEKVNQFANLNDEELQKLMYDAQEEIIRRIDKKGSK